MLLLVDIAGGVGWLVELLLNACLRVVLIVWLLCCLRVVGWYCGTGGYGLLLALVLACVCLAVCAFRLSWWLGFGGFGGGFWWVSSVWLLVGCVVRLIGVVVLCLAVFCVYDS